RFFHELVLCPLLELGHPRTQVLELLGREDAFRFREELVLLLFHVVLEVLPEDLEGRHPLVVAGLDRRDLVEKVVDDAMLHVRLEDELLGLLVLLQRGIEISSSMRSWTVSSSTIVPNSSSRCAVARSLDSSTCR